MTSFSASPATQRVIAGRYLLQVPLGRGGMGVVWRAQDSVLQRAVAVKEVDFPSHLSDDDRAGLRQRVFREARAAARLNHRGAVTVFDVVEEEGRTYIVMELVEAPTLADVVERQGPLDPPAAARLGVDLLGVLEAAHVAGIVHRDLKPSNVMVPAQGPARLADFGIASIKDDPKLTSSGMLVGSPAYMSPEQANGEETGPAVDLWSLGATLYFAVEGRSPFERGEAIATLGAVVHEEPAPMRRAGALGPVVQALLQKRPQDRPPGRRLRAMLQDALGGAPGAASPPPAPTPAPEPQPDATLRGTRIARPVPVPVDPSPPSLPERPRLPDGRRPWLWAVPLILVVVSLVGVAVLMTGGLGGSPTTTPASVAPDAGERPNSGRPEAATRTGGVPTGWTRYRDPATGFTIAYPAGWRVQRRGTITDFRDPRSGRYLRVDWTDDPGPSPQGAWEALEARFAAENPGYRRIHMTPTTFRGLPASDWEYTYGSRSSLHAVNLGMVTGRYGFALNFQSREEDWARSRPVLEQFKATFTFPR